MEFVLAKTHQIHHFLIAFFGVIGVFEVVARFLAVGTGVAVIREIYKFNHIISLVSLIYSAYTLVWTLDLPMNKSMGILMLASRVCFSKMRQQ